MGFKEKTILVVISFMAVFLFAGILYFQPPFFSHWIIKLESDTYDRQVKRYHKPLSEHPSIVIVDIDDRSIAEEGRWPWDRIKIAQLADKLASMGAKVVAFDMVFSEPQPNPVDQVLQAVNNPSLTQELDKVKASLDADAILAQALQKDVNILGFAFASNSKEQGILPKPFLELTAQEEKETLIPETKGYIGNLPVLQKVDVQGGFINATIDADGILRFSPLLMRDNANVYPSLALEAAKMFLSLPFSGIIASKTGHHRIIEAIQLGDISIPTDPWGRILVPYRGPAYSFPYISATDVLRGKASTEAFQGKLVFVGVSATASSDLISTPVSPVYPGTEVQATIASGIIDGYLPHKPNWGRGGAIIIVLVIGGIAALLFPSMSHTVSFLFAFAIIGIFEAINYWMWVHRGIVLSFFFPVPTLASIFIFDLVSTFIADKRKSKIKKAIFGPYVSPACFKKLGSKEIKAAIAGEDRELTLLSMDIIDFDKADCKHSLELYLTEMSRLIFAENGVVNLQGKGGVLAFWGAPLSQPDHPYLAVKTALSLQAKAAHLHLRVTIAVDTGKVHVGEMGSKYCPIYTAAGPAVDRTMRLRSLDMGIVVGEETRKQTEGRFKYSKQGHMDDQDTYQPLP